MRLGEVFLLFSPAAAVAAAAAPCSPFEPAFAPFAPSQGRDATTYFGVFLVIRGGVVGGDEGAAQVGGSGCGGCKSE